MATQAHTNFVSKTAIISRAMLDLYAPLLELNTLYNGVPDYDSQITQAVLDTIPACQDAGLTATQLADVEYVLSQIKDLITAQLAGLAVLGNLPT